MEGPRATPDSTTERRSFVFTMSLPAASSATAVMRKLKVKSDTETSLETITIGIKLMKRLFSRFSMLSVALMMAACTQTPVVDGPDDGQEEELTPVRELMFEIPEFKNVYEDETRVGIDISDGGKQYQFVWADGDEIGIFPEEGNQVAFSMTDGAGTMSADFDGGGWKLKSSSTYSAYYPLIRDFDLDRTKIPMDLSVQTQVGNNNFDHLSKYAYMAAPASKVNDYGTVYFNFKFLISVLHLRVKMPVAAKFTRAIIFASDNFHTTASLNLASGEVTDGTAIPLLTLNLEDVETTATGQNVDLFMAIRPVNMKGKYIKARFYTADGRAYWCRIADDSNNLQTYDYEAGSFYHMVRTAEKDNSYTGLPTVFVNTPVAQDAISHDIWQEGSTMTILMPDGTIDFNGSMQIKGRGNSTWHYVKKPYAIKLDSKEKVMGMAKHKRWCLLANWLDKTMMRNAVAFEIARKTGLDWTPSGQFVELMFNGHHKACYYLCEQIKVDKNRVNVTPLDINVTEGPGITGGYIFELDSYFDEVYKFRPTRSNLPWMFKDPDEVNTAQFNWVKNYVNEMEDALYDPVKFKNREFVKYMDLESYVDWWFVNELTMNSEIQHPKSCYMHKDTLGKMKAGPAWDYDWGTFKPEKTNEYRGKDGLYYPQLFKDAGFVELVKTRWAMFKPRFEEEIPAFIDATKKQLAVSGPYNASKWPNNSGSRPNGDEAIGFDEAVARLRQAYLDKLNWLDQEIQNMEVSPLEEDLGQVVEE